jgi:hypothetical protein
MWHSFHLRRAAWAPLLLIPITACLGEIGDGAGGNGSVGPGASSSSSAGSSVASSCNGALNPTTGPIRRLTNREYASTLGALLGTTVDVSMLPTSSAPNGYDTNDTSSPSLQSVQGYFNIAKTAVTAVVASQAQRTALFGCEPSGATLDSCLTTFISKFGLLAYRRVMTSDEVTGLIALAHTAAETDTYAGARMVMEAMLQSPNLLYRPEFGVADTVRPTLKRLTGFEIATRLSYLLWGVGPDAPLLTAAQAGKLDTADGVTSMVTTMLADARAHAGLQNFYSQWLRLYNSTIFIPQAGAYPAWTGTTASDMATETAKVVDDLAFRPGANFLDLLTANYSYVNPALATFYGVASPGGTDFARVTFGANDHRGGLLTQGSFLAFTSHPDTESVTRRGHYVRDVLLCEPLPPPPPNVNTTLPVADAGVTLRDLVSEHETNPACSSCHSQMDPIGFGLLQYDTVGQFHAADSTGQSFDVSGDIAGFADPNFTGPAELQQKLHDSPQVPHCITLQAFRFAMGRAEVADDACNITQVQSAFTSASNSLPALVSGFVQSDAFRYIPGGT